MRSRYTVREPERAHFVTSTIVDWLPVFHSVACCDILAGSLDFCRQEKGLRLYAWVIMENHFHAAVHADDLPRIMADLDVRPNLVWSRHLLNMDPPEHQLFRSVIAPRFTARALRNTAQWMESILVAALARLEAQGATWEGDFATEIARNAVRAVRSR